jgi:alcohol dehydrogenase
MKVVRQEERLKAAQMNEYGDANVVHIHEAAKPRVVEGKVLVEVHASSINPFDAKLRAGYMKGAIPLQFPYTVGGDIAGVVTEVGAGVGALAVGDKVYGQAAGVAGNSGAMAEYAVTAAGQVAKMPGNVDFNGAASLPLVGVSALQGLTEHLKLSAGQKLLVLGGSGGIGTVAIQIAKHLGAEVTATASGDGLKRVQELGADQVIDYKAGDFAAGLRDFDAMFDTVGGEEFGKALSVLKPGGVAVSMVGAADEVKAQELGVTAINQSTKVTTEALNGLRELVEAGVVKPQVARVFPLDEAAAAFAAWDKGGVTGKVVVAVR